MDLKYCSISDSPNVSESPDRRQQASNASLELFTQLQGGLINVTDLAIRLMDLDLVITSLEVVRGDSANQMRKFRVAEKSETCNPPYSAEFVTFMFPDDLTINESAIQLTVSCLRDFDPDMGGTFDVNKMYRNGVMTRQVYLIKA